MSDPDNAATQEAPSFEERVNQVVGQLTKGDDGKLKFPDVELSEELRFAAVAEKRRRDTQSALAKVKQSEKAFESEVVELKKKLSSTVVIPPDQLKELESLKYQDPDAWRRKVNDLEASTRQTIQDELSSITEKSSAAAELARRESVLEQFIEDNPGFELDDEILENEVPPRYARRLENGDVTFEEFLVEVKGYLDKGKVIGDGKKTLNQPNLGSIAGGSSADGESIRRHNMNSYAKEIY